jgi:broad specificity phosphatase PhoE
VSRTLVHLLRHGEVHNPEGLLYGRLPGYHLSELGQQMATAVADALADHDVSLVVASPLERAQETAQPIADRHGVPVLTDGRLIEAGNFFEGKTFGVGDGSLRHPAVWPRLMNPFRPSWGEAYERIAERMLEVVDQARQDAEGHEAVLVSHQSPVWIARLKLEGRRLWHDPRKRQCSLASLTTLTYDGDRLTSIELVEPAAHLLPSASTVAGA